MAGKGKRLPKGADPVVAPAVSAAGSIPLYLKMKANPKGDWNLKHVQTICEQAGLSCNPPTRGSHWKVRSPYVMGVLTIPNARPIKAPYIRDLVGLISVHFEAQAQRGNEDA